MRSDRNHSRGWDPNEASEDLRAKVQLKPAESEDVLDSTSAGTIGQAQDVLTASKTTRTGGSTASRSKLLLHLQQTNGNLAVQRLLQRSANTPLKDSKEPGSNGVADGAASAVAAAHSSQAVPLPGELATRFEQSLGTDLSHVRVHLGPESAEAASALSARAFTSGNDIHFAAGQYAPETDRGKHLLAHEVAHTVQQSGGGAAHMQFKLEVSTPGEAHEVEADRAADAMVAGIPAAVTGAPGAAMQRAVSEGDMIRAQQQNALQQFKPPTEMKGMTVNADISRCDEIIARIDDARGGLGQLQGAEQAMAEDHKDEKDYIPQTRGQRYIAINNATRTALDQMRQSAQKQQFDHGFFEPAYEQLSKEFVKLQSAVQMIKADNVGVAGAGNAVAKARHDNPIVNAKMEKLSVDIGSLRTLGAEIPKAVTGAEQTFRDVMLKIDMSRIPLPQLQDSAKQTEAAAKVKAVNDDLAAAKGAIATIQSTVTAAMSLYGGPEVMAAVNGMVDKAKAGLAEGLDKIATKDDAEAIKKGADVGADKGKDLLKDKLAEAMTNYQGRIARANGEVDALKKQISEIQVALDGRELLNLQVTLSEKTHAVISAVDEFERKKAALATDVKAIEVELKKMGGSASKEVSAAIQLETDLARFDSQADVTVSLGEKEQANAKDTEKNRKDAAGDYAPGAGYSGFSRDTEIAATQGGQKYWTCEVSRTTSTKDLEDLSGFNLEEHVVIFNVMESDKHQHAQVMSDSVQPRLDQVKEWKQEAAGYKSMVEGVLNVQPG